MREAYNECVPLLTAYSSELGQNTALQAAYAYVLRHEGGALEPAQRKVVENALRDFRLAESISSRDEKTRYCEVAQRLAQLATKFSENVLDAGRAYTRSVTDSAELAGLPANAIDRAAADAREAESAGMAVQTRSAHLHDDHGERRERAAAPRHLRSLDHPGLGISARAPGGSTIIPSSPRSCRCVMSWPAWWASATSPTTPWPRAWPRAASKCSAFWTTWRGAACPRRARNSRIWRSSRAANSTPGTWRIYSERLQESRFKVSQEALRPISRCPRC